MGGETMMGPSFPVILAIQSFLSTICLFLIAARSWLRMRIMGKRLEAGDAFIFFAWFLAMAIFASDVYYVIYLGMRRDTDVWLKNYGGEEWQRAIFLKLWWASTFVFLASCYLSKGALLCYYLHLFPKHMVLARGMLWAVIGYAGIGYVITVVIHSLGCEPIERNWSTNEFEKCDPDIQGLQFLVQWLLHFTSNIMLFALPFFILNTLNLDRYSKIAAYALFLLGVLIIALGMVRFGMQSIIQDIAVTAADLVRQTEAFSSITIALLPTVRPYLRIISGQDPYPSSDHTGEQSYHDHNSHHIRHNQRHHSTHGPGQDSNYNNLASTTEDGSSNLGDTSSSGGGPGGGGPPSRSATTTTTATGSGMGMLQGPGSNSVRGRATTFGVVRQSTLIETPGVAGRGASPTPRELEAVGDGGGRVQQQQGYPQRQSSPQQMYPQRQSSPQQGYPQRQSSPQQMYSQPHQQGYYSRSAPSSRPASILSVVGPGGVDRSPPQPVAAVPATLPPSAALPPGTSTFPSTSTSTLPPSTTPPPPAAGEGVLKPEEIGLARTTPDIIRQSNSRATSRSITGSSTGLLGRVCEDGTDGLPGGVVCEFDGAGGIGGGAGMGAGSQRTSMYGTPVNGFGGEVGGVGVGVYQELDGRDTEMPFSTPISMRPRVVSMELDGSSVSYAVAGSGGNGNENGVSFVGGEGQPPPGYGTQNQMGEFGGGGGGGVLGGRYASAPVGAVGAAGLPVGVGPRGDSRFPPPSASASASAAAAAAASQRHLKGLSLHEFG